MGSDPKKVELSHRIRSQLVDAATLRELHMFSGFVFMLNGAITVGAMAGGDLLVCIDQASRESLLNKSGAKPAVMGNGRSMGDSWIVVSDAALRSDKALTEWIALARGYNEKRFGAGRDPAEA